MANAAQERFWSTVLHANHCIRPTPQQLLQMPKHHSLPPGTLTWPEASPTHHPAALWAEAGRHDSAGSLKDSSDPRQTASRSGCKNFKAASRRRARRARLRTTPPKAGCLTTHTFEMYTPQTSLILQSPYWTLVQLTSHILSALVLDRSLRQLGDNIDPRMSRISVNLLLLFHHPSAEAVAHRPILPVSHRGKCILQLECARSVVARTKVQHRLTGGP